MALSERQLTRKVLVINKGMDLTYIDIDNLSCFQQYDSICITGSVESKWYDQKVIIGAYAIRNNEVIQVSSYAYVNQFGVTFTLKFDAAIVDNYLIYAKHVLPLEDQRNHYTREEYPEVLKNLIEIDEEEINVLGLKIIPVSLEIYDDWRGFIFKVEFDYRNIISDLSIECIVFDSDDNEVFSEEFLVYMSEFEEEIYDFWVNDVAVEKISKISIIAMENDD